MKAKELLTASFMAVFFSTQPFWNPPAQSQTLHDLDRELTEIITLISPRVVVVEARSRIMPVLPIPLRNRDVHDTVRAIIGSGLVIDSAGHILTVLSHVRGYDDFRVEQGGRWYSASLVGVDNRLGIGLLKSDLIIALPLSVVREEPAAGRLAAAVSMSRRTAA